MPDAAHHPTGKLILVDAYSLLFRAHFANPHFSTADGRPTGALFGFSNMLLALLNNHKPDAIVVCWDAPQKTLRKQEFDAYKAHRPEVDPSLKAQMPEARRIVEAFGIQSAEAGGYEADDLIGTLAFRGADSGMSVTIVTGDSDQLQLVTDRISVEISQRGVSEVKVYGVEEVQAKYGVSPNRIPDWKGLVGDTSDNIPGVPGIGEKTATALLQTYDTVENLLEHFAEVKQNKARLALEEYADQARLSKRLATIVCDAPIELHIEHYSPTAEDWQRTRELFQDLQFKSLLTRIPKAPAEGAEVQGALAFGDAAAERPSVQVTQVETKHEFDALVEKLTRSDRAGLAITTSGETAKSAYLKQLAVSTDGLSASIIDARGESVSIGLFEDAAESRFTASAADIARLLAIKSCAFDCHSAKLLLHAVSSADIALPAIAFDATIAAYLLESGRSSYPLDDLSLKYLGETFEPAGIGEEAALIFRLALPMSRQLEDLGMRAVFDKVDMPLAQVLVEVERIGLLIDRAYLSTLAIRLNSQMEALASEIYQLAGEEFNIGSTKQLQTILFEKLQLPTGKKTRTGYSTGADLLEQLAVEYPIARKITEYREISKLKSTYADSLMKLADPTTGRVHTTLNQTVASTGRLSSSDPNLQNIPIRSELGREIRRAFIAPQGRVLLSCDYSQIELRVLAHMSADPALTEAFVAHEDVHAATASKVFGVPLADVSGVQRRQAKTINFAVIYGQGPFALAATLGIDTKTASDWIKDYFSGMPGVQKFIADTTESARTNRYVSTLMGRRRYLPELDSPNYNIRQFAERAAVNMPIQGTAADIMKLAMTEVQRELQRNWSHRCNLLLQVHDELLLEVDAEAVESITPVIQHIMESVYPLTVPLVADAKAGSNWADMKPLKSAPAADSDHLAG